MDETQVIHGQYVQESEATRQEPLLKVYLSGSFRLRWQVPSSAHENLWDSRTSARSLFKLLLCMPERQAAKSLLAGILWPETDEEKALASLRSAVKVLRKVLCSANGEMLVEQPSSGSMLRLAGQRRLWVDIDGFEFCVAAASRAATQDEALVLWQEARTFLRGEFLAEDQQYEWFGSRPVKLRRQTLWMARSRMIRHLADLYIQRGEIALAEAISLLEEALTATPYQWLARQLGILIPLAMAYARIQERDQSLLTAQRAIPVIKAVNAPMTNTYFLEYVKEDVLGRFSHSREIQTFLTDTLIQLPQITSLLENPPSGKFLN